MSRPVRTRFYLGETFAVEHAPAENTFSGVAALLLPPLGYEDTCAYRPLRVLADRLAARGHLVLRPDWPAHGDSAGEPLEIDQVALGQEAVARAAAHLRARGATRVAGFAVRAGGLLALASEGLDDLALWAVPASGKAYLREERAFHQMAARAYGEAPPDAAPPPEGALEAGGFLYGPRTVAAFSGLSTEALAARGRWGRVLLLGRDGLAVPEGLPAAFSSNGAEVQAASPQGLADLLENAYKSELRPEVAELIEAWLEPARASAPVALRPVDLQGSLALPGGVREHPLMLEGGAGELSGILCEPEGGAPAGAPWTLFFNAGGIRRAGPNRLWTRAARALARRGVPSLRFDVRDVGDSDGVEMPHADLEAMYSESAIADALLAYDGLRARGAGAIDVVGLCSGSFLGVQTADRRPVRRALLINCLAFVWNDDARVSGVTSHIGSSLLDGRRWRRLLSGRIPAGRVMKALGARAWMALKAPFQPRDGEDEVAALLRRVSARGTELCLVSSEGDPSLPYLERHLPPEGRPPVTLLPGVDHTVRPVWAHRRVVGMVLGEPDDGAGDPGSDL
ncbi:MAG TPA: hypothetical protein VFT46_03260 [Holophagaceae bacterium]|nr:hypothetical protein [Holophagaceae bacterium]